MTNELEKHFFDAFEIKPKYAYLVTDMFYTSNSHNYEATKNDLIKYFGNKNCGRYKVTEVHKTYPQITDHILLELIIILGTICTIFDKNVDNLKENVLKNLIELSGGYHIYNQVRTLFGEG